MEYQGRDLEPIRKIIKKSKIVNALEKKLEFQEDLFIDTKFANFIFEKGKGPCYEKYNVYAWKYRGWNTPRFLTCVDRLFRPNGETIRYRIN